LIPTGYDSPDLVKSTGSDSQDLYEKVATMIEQRPEDQLKEELKCEEFDDFL